MNVRQLFGVLWAMAVQCFCMSHAVGQQMSAPGYWGAINTPIALALPQGSMALAMTNSTPETARTNLGVGSFGGMNMGLGLLPGLEAVGRLTYDGDLNCDTYSWGCRSATRDLSVGAKWQLPIEKYWPSTYLIQPHLAVGVSDYGGAASNYRQKYIVGSAQVGPWLLSAGKSATQANEGFGGLMHGAFGSVIYKLTDSVSLIAENDSKETRAGASFSHRITSNMDLNLAASKKLTHKSVQQAAQATLGLTYYFGRGERESAAKRISLSDLNAKPAQALTVQRLDNSAAAQTAPTAQQARGPLSVQETAVRMADVFHAMGFSDIDVAKTATGWMVQAEPRLWRQDRMDAMGAGLAAFVKSDLQSSDTVVLALTHMGQRVGGFQSTVSCSRSYIEGDDRCEGQDALKFFFDIEDVPQERDAQWLVKDAHDKNFMPQIEISPAASYTAGTEFGLFDYSLGVTTGWELPLAKGLSWQGFYAQLLSETDDFKNPNSYFRRVGLGEATRMSTNLLVYQRPILPRLWAQVAVGDLSYKTSGAQVNAYWASQDGKYRATWIYGHWSNPFIAYPRQPNILSLGVRPFASNVQFTYSTGRFQGNDKGHRLASTHYFHDYSIGLYVRKTGPSNLLPNKNAFMGFSITFPLGPNKALELGPVSVRARDRWELGLETKIQQKDNYIEPGYGAFPVIRHSLDTDIFDFNRSDLGLMKVNAFKIRVNARRALADFAKLPG